MIKRNRDVYDNASYLALKVSGHFGKDNRLLKNEFKAIYTLDVRRLQNRARLLRDPNVKLTVSSDFRNYIENHVYLGEGSVFFNCLLDKLNSFANFDREMSSVYNKRFLPDKLKRHRDIKKYYNRINRDAVKELKKSINLLATEYSKVRKAVWIFHIYYFTAFINKMPRVFLREDYDFVIGINSDYKQHFVVSQNGIRLAKDYYNKNMFSLWGVDGASYFAIKYLKKASRFLK